MTEQPLSNAGLKKRVKQCHHAFLRAENTDYYNDEDFQAAKHMFVKFCLLNQTGQIP